MSTKWPSIAAAAAIFGLTRWVRPPLPWRPSKLRFEVEAQRSPSIRMSGFIPRHIEHPASRHSKPAERKTSCNPSASASAFTCWEPGTTIPRTELAIRRTPTLPPPPGAGFLVPEVGTGADEAALGGAVGHRRTRLQIHVGKRPFGRLAVRRRVHRSWVGERVGHLDDPPAAGPPLAHR